MERNGRGERIRTSDPLVPNQVRYQTALRPELCCQEPLMMPSATAMGNPPRTVAEWMPVCGMQSVGREAHWTAVPA